MKTLPVFAKSGATIIAWTQVDDELYEDLSRYRWQLDSNGQVVRVMPGGPGFRLLSRQVAKVKREARVVVHHRDGDVLNNCRDNLKIERLGDDAR